MGVSVATSWAAQRPGAPAKSDAQTATDSGRRDARILVKSGRFRRRASTKSIMLLLVVCLGSMHSNNLGPSSGKSKLSALVRAHQAHQHNNQSSAGARAPEPAEYEEAGEPENGGPAGAGPLVPLVPANNNQADEDGTTRTSPLDGQDAAPATTLSISSLFSHIDKQWKFAEVILIIVISAILNLVTIIGNIMVLISFKMDRSLQTVSNYFLLSLALADLLIGLISMPLYTLYLLLNYWPLGPLMCDIWLAIDYLNSNAAVLNMLIISFDRYFSVTRPLTYRAKRTTKHACLMISCAWILSLTIWTPAIFTYPYYKGRTVQGTDKCEIEFVKANTYLTFVTAILAFYIPVIIMIYLYWRIWLETKKRYRDLTTLFLVSGVGAAAPARPTRPGPGARLANSTTNSSNNNNNKQLAANLPGQVTLDKNKASALAQQQRREPAPGRHQSGRRNSAIQADMSPFSIKSQQMNNSINPAASGGGGGPAERQQQQQRPRQASPARLDNGAKPISQDQPAGRCQLCKCPTCPRAKRAHPRCPRCLVVHTPAGRLPAVDLQFQSNLANCKLCQDQVAANTTINNSSPIANRAHVGCCPPAPPKWRPSGDEPAPPATPRSAKRPHYHHHHHHHNHHHHHQQQQQRQHASTRRTGASCCCCHSSGRTQVSRREPGAVHSSGQSHQNPDQKQRPVHEPKQAQPDNEPAPRRPTGKLSLLSSGYQFLSGASLASSNGASLNNFNSSSLVSCAQISVRKIHPKTSGAELNDHATVAGGGLRAGATKLEPASGQNEAQAEVGQQMEEASGGRQPAGPDTRTLVDVATSPIDLNSARSPLWTTATNVSLFNDDEREDFETRIVSVGDQFRFETNDPKLAGSAACARAQRPAPACRYCAKWACPAASKWPGACCCAEGAHEPECRACAPAEWAARQHQHQPAAHARNHHHHHHAHQHPKRHRHRHHHHHECRQCARPRAAEAAVHEQAAGPAAVGERAPAGALPILGALHQPGGAAACPDEAAKLASEQTGGAKARPQPPGAADDKRAKKFNQKLTFSDILVERAANCQRGLVGQEPRADADRAGPAPATSLIRRLLGGGSGRARRGPGGEAGCERRHQDDGEPDACAATIDEPANKLVRAIWCSRSRLLQGPVKRLAGPAQRKPARTGSSSEEPSEPSGPGQTVGGETREPGAHQHQMSCSSGGASKPSYSSHHPIQPKSERKAAKTLSTLLLVFIVTWLPYNVLVLIKTLSGGEDQVPEKIWNFSYYLCYINSTINPLCYALCNAQFRRTYMRILKCKLSNEHNSTRRLVPIQSSTTWNKDLRLSSETNANSAASLQGAPAAGHNGAGHLGPGAGRR